MARLTDAAVQNNYVARIVELHDNWDKYSVNRRRAALLLAIREATQAVHVSPLLTVTWTDGDAFTHNDWSLDLHEHNATDGPSDFKRWAQNMTAPYHETRHAEQVTMVLEGFCKGALALPQKVGSRAVVANVRTEPGGIVAAVAARTEVPLGVVRFAYQHRMDFQDSEIPLARSWADSYFGGLSRYGEHVQDLNTRGPNFNTYVNLPEERDTFAIEREVRRRIKEVLGSRAESEALDGLSSLYRPSYSEWIAKTARTGHWRSVELTILDNVLRAFESNRATLARLKAAFDHWYTRNPKEALMRNKDGCVDRLKAFVGS